MSKFNKTLHSFINSYLLILLSRRSYCQLPNLAMDNLHSKIKISERLSKSVIPLNYKLMLHPDLEAGTFLGNVDIRVQVKEERNHINLHTNFLNIKSVKVFRKDQELSVSKFLEVSQLEQLLISFNQKINPGVYNLQIDFTGDLTCNIVGFYSSRFKNGIMAASKFQPTYARQAFPCFDEPDFKATFDVTLVKPRDYTALSNMNEISIVHDEKTNEDAVTFATSVPMSTYLACFVVCDFGHIETEINSNGIGKNFKLRSFAQKDQMHKIEFAQDIGRRATEFYINYYQVPFPLPKLDMIAIPDYVSGATEHWGLITYRETSFLIDEETASASNKIAVANTIAHELAHMWFGNLVTMKWWDEVWLNEGFASYMEVKALDAIEPSWTMLDQFLIDALHRALVIDAKLSSHPIVQTVSTPDQITAIFDAISYNKGASILRMLEGFVGEESFRRGVMDYLRKYEFGNTVTKDLLNALEPYFKKDNPDLSISYIMDTWTRQMGYPLLTVAHGQKPGSYSITQSRFLLDPDANYHNDSQFNYRWFVPVTYKTNNGSNNNILWFPDNVEKVTIQLKETDSWLKINNNQVGYYRVNYPTTVWHELIKQLQSKSNQLTISDRAHLLNDIYALAEAKAVPYELALQLTTYLKVEDQYVPWTTAGNIFSDLNDKLMDSPAYDDFLIFVQKLVAPLYGTQSWSRNKNLTVIESLIRTKILGIATKYGIPDAKSKVREIFLNWLNSYGTPAVAVVEPDLRLVIYNYGMTEAAMSEWDKLWQIYLKEQDAQEQAKLRRALAAPNNTDILKKYLTLAWDETNIRGQDYLTVLDYIAANPSGTQLVWSDVRARWPQFVERFSLNSRYLGNMVLSITESFNTEARLKEMEAFFEKYPEAGAGEAARRRALESAKHNVQWTRQNRPAVARWLAEHARTT